MNDLLQKLRIRLPIIQAPMAGVSTPALAAAVCNAGGLGSLGIGSADVATARKMIAETRALTDRPFQVNLFCHERAVSDTAKEAAWLARFTPAFAQFGTQAPQQLRANYPSFVENEAMFELMRTERPPVISFHFGLPSEEWLAGLRNPGTVLLASATNLSEARAIANAGLDGVIAQGYEAGGHRGVFDPARGDDKLGVFALTRLIERQISLPVIAAGGIMDGAGIAAVLSLGASAAQLGTAFIACPESAASEDYRATLFSPVAEQTFVTRRLSGRDARALPNRLTELVAAASDDDVPAYPVAYDAAKQLIAAAKGAGVPGYGAYLAGQGAPLARAFPAAELLGILERELELALGRKLDEGT
ncbi:Nitronate monooxygenase [Anatilimnocola aggregata]|uniref:Nitronate monooxygenase n=1 Tax=Anatilimnocola aggregata TaxID=2528021 RepID=A0A517Y5P5_9BACT|nr:nitronate monooxygenase [Anatilimnocola aggregata]QDU25526.1 Nitronate monooxygenase [Anatilimnocola aggregata]